MDRRTTYLVLFTLSVTSGIAGLPATSSAAEGPIGVTATVRNTVSQLEPRVTRIVKGDEVVRNEVVRTAADSDARFVLRDDTNLSLGPGSTLKLDRTVFDDPKAGDIAIKLTQGAFRFVTGHSEKEAYVISTPLATIGVRGTALDFLVKKRQNKIVLAAGKATICVPGKCVDLIHEGDSVNITSSGKGVSIDVQSGSDWNFDQVCGSSCGTSTFAEAGGKDITTASISTWWWWWWWWWTDGPRKLPFWRRRWWRRGWYDRRDPIRWWGWRRRWRWRRERGRRRRRSYHQQ